MLHKKRKKVSEIFVSQPFSKLEYLILLHYIEYLNRLKSANDQKAWYPYAHYRFISWIF